MGEFNSDDHYIYYWGQEYLRRNGVAIMINKRVQNAVLGCNLTNDRMILVRFQGKPFNIMIIKPYDIDNFSSVQFCCSVVSLWPHESQPARPPCRSSTPKVYPNPHPLSQWCHLTISSSVIPFSSPQSFLASGSFPVSQLFTSSGQSIGVSASTSVLRMNTQDWSPLGWTGWISLKSKGLSRVFSSTIVQKHQFFSTQLSL